MDSPNKHLELLDNAIPETQTNPQDWPGKTGKARPPPRRTLQKASGRPSSSGVAEQNHKDYRHNIHRIHRNTLLKKHHRTWGKWTKYDQIMVEARQFWQNLGKLIAPPRAGPFLRPGADGITIHSAQQWPPATPSWILWQGQSVVNLPSELRHGFMLDLEMLWCLYPSCTSVAHVGAQNPRHEIELRSSGWSRAGVQPPE